MEQSLMKGRQIQDDCATSVKKLRAMLHSSEDQLRVHKKQTLFLTQLTAKTLPKGLHCLPLSLTTEYYNLNSSQQQFPNQEKLEDPGLYHYAIFSDNILATAVVVNSTAAHAKVSYFRREISRVVFISQDYETPNKIWYIFAVKYYSLDFVIIICFNFIWP
jgi:alpha-1,4-galacturonosyltransferase